MSRRLDIELTSTRPDGSWTWRAAGAKQPKGEIAPGIVPEDASVGAIVRAEAEFGVDGIEIVAVARPKADNRVEPERIVVTGTRRTEELVNVTYAERGKGKGRRRDDGDGRRPREGGRGDGGDRPRRDRTDRTDRSDRTDRGERGGPRGGSRDGRGPRRDAAEGDARKGERPARRPVPHEPPRLKRLKAGRKHRNALVRSLPELQQPLARLLLRGDIAAVRQAVTRQNELAAKDGLPQVSLRTIEGIADKLRPLLRSAEWYDRAEAAMTQLDQLDLRDLRSVVVAADSGARDDEARAMAVELRAALTRRVDEEHRAWLDELTTLLADGRVVRALRLSSRPPKAGAPLPPEIAQRLATAASSGLTADTFPDRYAMLIEAVAFSPVRLQVVPEALPSKTSDELTAAVTKLAARVPQIAQRFGIEPAPAKS